MVKQSASERAAEIHAKGQITAAKIGIIGAIAVAIVSGVFYGLWVWLNPSNSKATNSAISKSGDNSQNLTFQGNISGGTFNVTPPQIDAPDDKISSSQPPPPPPESFPDLKGFGIPSLTDAQRQSANYNDSILEVFNRTNQSIRLAIAFVPHSLSALRSSLSPYAQQITGEVLPGELQEKNMEYFGGAVHLSVLSEGKWQPMNEWVDMRVVARRTIEVTHDEKGFTCHVRFEEGTK